MIGMLVVMLAGLAPSGVYDLSPFAVQQGASVSTLSNAAADKFTLMVTNAPADTRVITSAALGGGRTFAIGESVELSFTFSSTQISTLSLGFGWGFDFGTNVVFYTADTGVPAYTFHQHRYDTANGFPFTGGAGAGSWASTPLPVSTDYFSAGNSVDVVTTLERVDADQYTSSVQWGGQVYTSSFTCVSDPSMDTVFFRSGSSSSPGLSVGDNYTISDVSLSFSEDEATVITMDESGDHVDLLNNNISAGRVSYATTEQGSAFFYTNSVFEEAGALFQASYASRKPSGYGLDYTLPARTVGVPYPADVPKDRLETIIWDEIPLEHVSETAHYTGFSVKIPSGRGLVNDWFLFHQWHQSSPESPPISMHLLEGYYARLGVQVRYGEKKGNETHFYLPRVDNSSGDTFIDLPRNKWIDFIIRWKFDVSGADGEVIVYRHDSDWSSSVQVFNYTGQVGYTNVVDGDLLTEKTGIYRYKDYDSEHSIFIDQIRVGHGYNEVRPWQ